MQDFTERYGAVEISELLHFVTAVRLVAISCSPYCYGLNRTGWVDGNKNWGWNYSKNLYYKQSKQVVMSDDLSKDGSLVDIQ